MNDYILKDVCIFFCAQKIIHNGVAYKVPAAWQALYPAPKAKPQSDRVNPHVPALTAVKEQQLFADMEGEG